MIRADYQDKDLVVNILTRSFDDNKSVNYIISQDEKRARRIRVLMEYSFDMCSLFGKVYLSDDKSGCALILLPDQKKTWRSILLDLRLAVSGIGLSNIRKVIDRESKIKKRHPEQPIHYLWFIGVDPIRQNQGTGTALMLEVIKESVSKRRAIYLETSTRKNIPWYEKLGFEVYDEIDFGYQLVFMRGSVPPA